MGWFSASFKDTLQSAALHGDLQAMERILHTQPASLNQLVPIAWYGTRIAKKKPLCEAAALHCAVAWHRSEAVTALLRAGADVHVRSFPADITALHLASAIARPDIVRALLDGGADLEARDALERTP